MTDSHPSRFALNPLCSWRNTADPNAADIIDETLDLFRANSLFRNFEIKGGADRLLIVLILFVSDCLAKIAAAKTVPAKIEAGKLLNTLAVDNFPLPGEVGFVLNTHYIAPATRVDAGAFQYFIPFPLYLPMFSGAITLPSIFYSTTVPARNT